MADILRSNSWGTLWTSLVAMQILSYPRERKGFHDCSPTTSLIWVKSHLKALELQMQKITWISS